MNQVFFKLSEINTKLCYIVVSSSTIKETFRKYLNKDFIFLCQIGSIQIKKGLLWVIHKRLIYYQNGGFVRNIAACRSAYSHVSKTYTA